MSVTVLGEFLQVLGNLLFLAVVSRGTHLAQLRGLKACFSLELKELTTKRPLLYMAISGHIRPLPVNDLRTGYWR
jgi:hypothetical protein